MTGSSKDPLAQLSFFFSQPLDRDQPNGRPQWRFTVFAQDEGGEGLVGYADVQVNLKDINDNAPIFPQGIYFGNVTENGTAGPWEMTDGVIRARLQFSYPLHLHRLRCSRVSPARSLYACESEKERYTGLITKLSAEREEKISLISLLIENIYFHCERYFRLSVFIISSVYSEMCFY